MDEIFPTRIDRLYALNADLHSYLQQSGYDEGTQLSLQAIYLDLQEIAQLSEAQAQAKVHIRLAWEFIRGIVLSWYYEKKAELETIEDYLSYAWDFQTLNVHDPCVSLREILTLLSNE